MINARKLIVRGALRCPPYCMCYDVRMTPTRVTVEGSDLIEYWGDARSPAKFTTGSNVVASWRCPEGHTWDQKIKNFASNPTCRFCKNSLPDELVKEWYDENPHHKYSYGSQYMATWKCPNGHIYKCTINNRTSKGVGCQTCKSLGFLYPELLSMWNDEVDPLVVSAKSHKKFNVTCRQGHKFKQSVANFTAGAGCPVCSNKRVIPGVNDVGYSNYFADPGDALRYSRGSDAMVKSICECGAFFVSSVRQVVNGVLCPSCRKGRSAGEREVAEHVNTITCGLSLNSRGVIPPLELDMYIPEKRIAIEYNGLYWHSEERVGRTYHYDKWLACQQAGIQLITIWEDDWNFRRETVKRMLDVKINGRPTVGARKTTLVETNFSEAASFLDEWHIQGHARGSRYIGLYQDNLVAVGVFRHTRGGTYLERYSSSLGVQGGLDKMIRHIAPEKLITFADHSVSNGGLYSHWKVDGAIKPDYKYVYRGQRVHKFNFRKQRFKSDPALFFDPTMSESQLAKVNNIPRVYDCGKTRYLYR